MTNSKVPGLSSFVKPAKLLIGTTLRRSSNSDSQIRNSIQRLNYTLSLSCAFGGPLTLLLEIVDVEICDNKVTVLLHCVLVPLLELAGEHDDDLLLSCIKTRPGAII